MSEKTRRSFLRKATVTSVGTLSVTGIASAEDNHSLEGVDRAIDQLLAEGDLTSAEQLADRHDIELSTMRKSLTSDEVTTDGYWKDPGPDYNVGGWLALYIMSPTSIDADYRVRADWFFEEDDVIIEGFNTCPLDGGAIFWNGDYFVPDGVSSGNFHTSDSEVSYGGIETYNGVLAEIDDPLPPSNGEEDYWGASFAVDMNKVQDGASNYPFMFEYQHTYIDTLYKTCLGVDVSFSLGPGSITVDGDTKGWVNAVQNTIP